MKFRIASYKEVWNLISWVIIGWGAFHVMKWILGDTIHDHGVIGFIVGLFVMFFGLTAYGLSLKKQDEYNQKQAAMNQFIEDQKADKEQESIIDKQMIEQLKNEHALSGTQQDKRLKALETALKHLRNN